jgi:hypothetical protein
MSLLRTRLRRRIVLPHRIIEALRPFMSELADLLESIGAQLEDERWDEASLAVTRANERLKEPSVLYETVRQLEQIEPPQPIDEQAQPPAPPAPTVQRRTPLERLRKGMASVRPNSSVDRKSRR